MAGHTQWRGVHIAHQGRTVILGKGVRVNVAAEGGSPKKVRWDFLPQPACEVRTIKPLDGTQALASRWQDTQNGREERVHRRVWLLLLRGLRLRHHRTGACHQISKRCIEPSLDKQ
jgi:hypothetical protein